MLVIGQVAKRIAAGCCNYIHTRFPPGHDVPVCTIDQEWFADLAQKEIHAGADGDNGENLDSDWLRDVGFIRGMFPDDLARGPIVRGIIRNAQSPANNQWHWTVRTWPIPQQHQPRCRDDVRRLCASLGVPL
jgi:hypothetical protein